MLETTTVTARHRCGHTEDHQVGGDLTAIGSHFASTLCSHCQPTCEFCHRRGPREKMLITEEFAYCHEWCKQQSDRQTHYREHNSIEIPEWLRKSPWQDRSYHNDACGRSEIDLPNGKSIIAWVEHLDPDQREGEDRYCIQVGDVGDDCDTLYAGESETEAKRAVFRFLVWFHAQAVLKEIAGDRKLQACASYSALHDICDANMLGHSEWLLETWGMEYATDVMNAASDAIDQFLQSINGVSHA